MKNIWFVILFLLITPCFSWGDAQDDWLATLKQHFDIVETFDKVANWPVSSGTIINTTGYITDPAKFPKYINGSPTPITEYAWWVNSPPTTDWIADHRSSGGYIFDPNGIGGKSIIWDMSHRQNNGLGDGINHGSNVISMNFSNGSRSTGYTDFYFFYMARYPVNYFPTSLTTVNGQNNVGVYAAGNPYLWTSSTKTVVVTSGLNGPMCHADDSNHGCGGSYNIDPAAQRGGVYGWLSRIFHFRPGGASSGGGYVFDGYYEGNNLADDTIPLPPWYDECQVHGTVTPTLITNNGSRGFWYTGTLSKWLGFEIHLKLNTVGNSDGIMDVKLFDPTDPTNPLQLLIVHNAFLMPSDLVAAGDKINRVWLGENNSNTWLWGDTMDPKVYIDDMIVSSGPIADTYFGLLDSETCSIDFLPACNQAQCEALSPTHYWYTSACHADELVLVDGVCGSNNNQDFLTLNAGHVNNCTIGTVANFTGTGPWSWDCTDTGNPAHCTAWLLQVSNGIAGSGTGNRR